MTKISHRIVICTLLLGCPPGDAERERPSTRTQALPAGKAAAAQARPRVGPKLAAGRVPTFRVPVGPGLPIQPGKGVGPIRFGASMATIERLIGEPCEEREGSKGGRVVCRYSAQAVEFVLADGALEQVHVHGRGRLVRDQPRLEFGIFNGGFVEGARLGMLRRGVVEFLGEARRVEPVEPPDRHSTVERHHYAGCVLEYKRSRAGQLVLDGVVLQR